MDVLRPLHRCMGCVSADAEIVLSGNLELCLSCLQRRLTPVEPGKRLTIVLQCEGYDYQGSEGVL
jgi:hypothetical protein